MPHHACPSCGSYKGRKAVPAKEE
ncbi:MAG: 50S ribosomal protein L32 [Desulfobacterales bacterium]|nr:50S ribosomal protein L32 [Desulfobacterales bacterium]